ncbi:late competence development ComFB family protein [Pannus brasiliensis CCIBt3594]|uniref:Late competence development ComFB family protein n=1 Tax=Pannus brasiliensis CCIBt3594 TaxID=1427578 RepID=A0AAW9QVM3_9CHRO
MNRQENLPKIHLNVMEELVREEIDRQLRAYPPSLTHYIDRVEVATYALNRLPPLYASSQKGKHHQKAIALQKYREQIQNATRQGIAAVRRDPLRSSSPLVSTQELNYRNAERALMKIQEVFERDLGVYYPLSWENLPAEVCRAISRIRRTRAAVTDVSGDPRERFSRSRATGRELPPRDEWSHG